MWTIVEQWCFSNGENVENVERKLLNSGVSAMGWKIVEQWCFSNGENVKIVEQWCFSNGENVENC
jgi:hypothetical protein